MELSIARPWLWPTRYGRAPVVSSAALVPSVLFARINFLFGLAQDVALDPPRNHTAPPVKLLTTMNIVYVELKFRLLDASPDDNHVPADLKVTPPL
jgi:hypothetical protein